MLKSRASLRRWLPCRFQLKSYDKNRVYISIYSYFVQHVKYQNFMFCKSLMIYLKLGLLFGSRSQHLFISLAKDSGVFLGMVGLRSLFKTQIETCSPCRSKIIDKITFERRFSGSYFPKNDSIAEHISFLTIFLTGYHLRRHPLVGSDLSCHIVVKVFGPSEISQFYMIAII